MLTRLYIFINIILWQPILLLNNNLWNIYFCSITIFWVFYLQIRQAKTTNIQKDLSAATIFYRLLPIGKWQGVQTDGIPRRQGTLPSGRLPGVRRNCHHAGQLTLLLRHHGDIGIDWLGTKDNKPPPPTWWMIVYLS